MQISLGKLFVKDLEEINKNKIETNSIIRLRGIIERFNKNINKLEVDLGPEGELLPHQVESLNAIKLSRQNLKKEGVKVLVNKDGYVIKPFTAFVCTAEFKGQPMKFEYEIR